jgi:hypothetical protein
MLKVGDKVKFNIFFDKKFLIEYYTLQGIQVSKEYIIEEITECRGRERDRVCDICPGLIKFPGRLAECFGHQSGNEIGFILEKVDDKFDEHKKRMLGEFTH